MPTHLPPRLPDPPEPGQAQPLALEETQQLLHLLQAQPGLWPLFLKLVDWQLYQQRKDRENPEHDQRNLDRLLGRIETLKTLRRLPQDLHHQLTTANER